MSHRISAIQLTAHLKEQPLPAISVIYGSEALLNQEALDTLRTRAKIDGYQERKRLDAPARGSGNWTELLYELEAPSLFAPTQLIEMHSPIKKVDKTISTILERIATRRNPQTRLILNLPNLESPEKQSWYKAIMRGDTLEITTPTLTDTQFTQEIRRRLSEKKLHLTDSAYHLFLDYHEGNLLAAQQSIDRLAHYPDAQNTLDDEHIQARLDDLSRLSIRDFQHAHLIADWLSCYRIAEKIEQEDKRQITLLTWTLAQDSNTLLQLATRPIKERATIFQANRIYSYRQKQYTQAIAHHRPSTLIATLKLAAKLDRISKGAEHGNPWLTLKQYCLLRVRK